MPASSGPAATTSPDQAQSTNGQSNSRYRSLWTGTSGIALAIATLTAALTGPGQTIGVSVFIDHFIADLAITRSEVAGAYLVGTIAGSATLPVVGSFLDRNGVRRAQILVGIAFTLALINMSLVNNLVWLALGFLGIRLLGQGALSLISTVTVSVSFDRNRGTALGLFATLSGGLMFLVPVALALVINNVGWRNAWLVAAATVAATVIPFAIFGLRSVPTGAQASGRNDDPNTGVDTDVGVEILSAEAGPTNDRSWHFNRSQAMATRGFWIIGAMTTSTGMLSTALNFHQIDLLGEAGLSAAQAAAMFIPQIVGSTIAGMAVGWISDRVGSRFLPSFVMAMLVAVHLIAAVLQPGVSIFVYAILLGATGASSRTVSSVTLADWFGTTHLGVIQGTLVFFSVVGSAIGPVALAVTESQLGGYTPAVLMLSLIALAAGLFGLTKPGIDSRNAKPAVPGRSDIAR